MVFLTNRNFKSNHCALEQKSCTTRYQNIFANVCVVYNKHAHILKTHAGALSSRKESAWCCGSLVLLIYPTNIKVTAEVGILLQMSAVTRAIVSGLFYVLCRKLLNYTWYSSTFKRLMRISYFFHKKKKNIVLFG